MEDFDNSFKGNLKNMIMFEIYEKLRGNEAL